MQASRRIVLPSLVLAVLALPAVSQTAPWIVQAPLPTGRDLQSIALADNQHAFAVTLGAGGALFETRNGGLSWTQCAVSSGGAPFCDVLFADATHGWVVGTSDFIHNDYRTTDAGATWIPMTPTSGSWIEAHALDAQHVWLDAQGFDEGSVSHDGGLSWTRASGVRALDFHDATVGVGVGPAGIYRTGDGGQSWQLRQAVASANKVAFLDASTALVSTPGELWRSIDAGLTWSTLSGSPAGIVEIQRLGPTNVVVIPSFNQVWRSTDAGASWQMAALPGLSSIDGPTALQRVSDSALLAFTAWGHVLASSDVGATWTRVFDGPGIPLWRAASSGTALMAVGNSGLLLRSEDSGANWHFACSGLGGSTLNDVKAWDEWNAIAVGDDGVALVTHDGGQSWIPGRPGLEFGIGQRLSAVSVVGAATAVAVGWNGDIIRTIDGGASWSDISPFQFTDFSGVDFLSSNEGWICSELPSSILHTIDGGATWVPQFPSSSYTFAAIDFVDPLHGWAAGLNDVVYRTQDGGNNWVPSAIPNPDPSQTSPTDVRFVDTLRGWIVGENQLILHTLDGGSTWTVQRFLSGGDLLSKITPVDADEAWISSYSGSALHTTDAGATWNSVSTGQEGSSVLSGIAATSSGVVWAVGERGLVVRNTVPESSTPFCFGDGTITACPCGNPSAGAGRGCDNSSSTGGASLHSVGQASLGADTLSFTTAGEKPTAASIVLQGTSSILGGLDFGQGLRCVSGGLKRLYVRNAIGGSIHVPGAGDPGVSARSAALGDTIPAGTQRYYMVYYRDPIVLGGCPAVDTFNATNALEVSWSP